MAEALPPIFDAARDVNWSSEGERKPYVDGVLRSYGRQLRDAAMVLGIPLNSFVAFPGEKGRDLILGGFVKGSYEAIDARVTSLPGQWHILREGEARFLAPELVACQNLNTWTFLESPSFRAVQEALAARFPGSGLVLHRRSIHGESPFCGAWVVTHTQK